MLALRRECFGTTTVGHGMVHQVALSSFLSFLTKLLPAVFTRGIHKGAPSGASQKNKNNV